MGRINTNNVQTESRSVLQLREDDKMGIGFMGIFGNGEFRLYTESGHFTVPVGITKLRVRVLGAGGNNHATPTGGGASSFGAILSATGGFAGPGTTSGEGSTGGNGVGGDFNANGGKGLSSNAGSGGGGGAGSQLGNGGGVGSYITADQSGGIANSNNLLDDQNSLVNIIADVTILPHIKEIIKTPTNNRFPFDIFGLAGSKNSGGGGVLNIKSPGHGGGGAPKIPVGVNPGGYGGGTSGYQHNYPGAGGGGYAHKTFTVTPGENYIITVGTCAYNSSGLVIVEF
jgi:hypothetical protein